MVQDTMVKFSAGNREVMGYLAVDASAENSPGLIIIHEWWGLNEHIKDIARRFAREGYVAFAPDLYDGKITKDPDEAAKYMQGLNQESAIEVLNGACRFLQSQGNVDSSRIGVTGFCMGGSYALLLACLNEEIKASVPFYGDVPSEDTVARLSAPLLFIGAENDAWITKDKQDRLSSLLVKYKKEGEVLTYPGAGHAFFNDTRPEAFNKEAAEDAWQKVKDFFGEKLKRS